MYGGEVLATIVSNIKDNSFVTYFKKLSYILNIILSLIIYFLLLYFKTYYSETYGTIEILIKFVLTLFFIIISIYFIGCHNIYLDFTVVGLVSFFAVEFVGPIDHVINKIESRFTKFFEGYWLPTRFGFDFRRIQFSSLILTGQMTREEALHNLETPSYDNEMINQEFNYISTKLGISPDELRSYHKMPKKFYWDYKNNLKLFKMGAWFMSRFIGTQRGGAF